jgi:hypothetical protein
MPAIVSLTLCLMVLALAACQAPVFVLPADVPEPAAADAPGLAIETAEVVVGVGSPIPVDVAITGHLPDTCTQIGAMEQTVDGFNIRIAVKAVTPALGGCIVDSVPFRVAMPLNTVSLPDGTYTVTVNDSVSTTFSKPVQPGMAPADLRPIPVSNVAVEVGVGSPIPVDAFVSGEWPDLCAQLAEVRQRLEGNTLEISLLAAPADPACPPDHLGIPFRIAIPINIVQLPEGAYTVRVNGVAAAFEIPLTLPAGRSEGD